MHRQYLEEYRRDLQLNGGQPDVDDTNYELLDFEWIDPDEPWILPDHLIEEHHEDEPMQEQKQSEQSEEEEKELTEAQKIL